MLDGSSGLPFSSGPLWDVPCREKVALRPLAPLDRVLEHLHDVGQDIAACALCWLSSRPQCQSPTFQKQKQEKEIENSEDESRAVCVVDVLTKNVHARCYVHAF